MWCTCLGRGKTQSGYTRQKDSDLWVCGKCKQPTRMVFEGLTSMRCPNNATAILSEHGRTDGIHELRWATTEGKVKTTLVYLPYPKKVGMASGPALLERTWEKLDEAFAGLMENPGGPEADMAKVKCRAIAEIIAILMQPFFDNADDVAKEASRRYKAKQSGDTDYETPGLASKIWDPNTRWDGTPYATTPEKRKMPSKSPVVKNAKALPEKAIPAVKMALESGKFTVAQLAKMYGVSDETVREAARS